MLVQGYPLVGAPSIRCDFPVAEWYSLFYGWLPSQKGLFRDLPQAAQGDAISDLIGDAGGGFYCNAALNP